MWVRAQEAEARIMIFSSQQVLSEKLEARQIVMALGSKSVRLPTMMTEGI